GAPRRGAGERRVRAQAAPCAARRDLAGHAPAHDPGRARVGRRELALERHERTEDGPMPPTLTFPGVYIEEAPSSVHPITAVATSITAFVGRALRGPVDQAITITSLSDFERIFGARGSRATSDTPSRTSTGTAAGRP